jgi:hypothetical protein
MRGILCKITFNQPGHAKPLTPHPGGFLGITIPLLSVSSISQEVISIPIANTEKKKIIFFIV